LLGDKFAFVKEKRDDGRLECDVLPECQVESFYSSPADSKLFKIVYARSIEHRAKRCLVEKCELVRKAVCLPQTTGGGYSLCTMKWKEPVNLIYCFCKSIVLAND
jgi:hypothetical protein